MCIRDSFQQADGGGVIRSDIRGKKAGGAARRLAQDINAVSYTHLLSFFFSSAVKGLYGME